MYGNLENVSIFYHFDGVKPLIQWFLSLFPTFAWEHLFAHALPNLQLIHLTLAVVVPRLSRKKEKNQKKRNVNVVH